MISYLIIYRFSFDRRLSPSETQLHLKTGFENLHVYDGKHSLLQQFLSRELFESLKELRTSYKSTLYDCIRSGNIQF